MNIVLIADESAILFIEDIRQNIDWGYRITFIFTSSDKIIEKYGKIYKILPEKTKMVINDLMEVDTIDEVIYIKKEANLHRPDTSKAGRKARSCLCVFGDVMFCASGVDVMLGFLMFLLSATFIRCYAQSRYT